MPTMGAAGDPTKAGLLPLRRLTSREYNNTVFELLGYAGRPADAFPAETEPAFLFHRAGLVATQDALLLAKAADDVAAAAVKNLSTLLPCDPVKAGEDLCAQRFIETFGLRAYRRPLDRSEVTRHLALFSTARMTAKLPFGDAIGLLIGGMLQSPAFLYHFERDPGPPVREGGLVQLGPYEMASRLSYFIWGSMPDRDLFAAAAANKLVTAAEVEAQV